MLGSVIERFIQFFQCQRPWVIGYLCYFLYLSIYDYLCFRHAGFLCNVLCYPINPCIYHKLPDSFCRCLMLLHRIDGDSLFLIYSPVLILLCRIQVSALHLETVIVLHVNYTDFTDFHFTKKIYEMVDIIIIMLPVVFFQILIPLTFLKILCHIRKLCTSDTACIASHLAFHCCLCHCLTGFL